LTGQQDSDFTNTDSGFVNGVLPAVGLTATDSLYSDHVAVQFYSSPSDPALGTGKFGIAPQVYRLYASTTGANPGTLVTSFDADDGVDTLIPAMGGLLERPGKVYTFDFTGQPFGSVPLMRGVDVTFRVLAVTIGYTTVQTPDDIGTIAGLDRPTNFAASKGLFTDKVRLQWHQPNSPAGIYPDGYIIQYQGEFDQGWNNLTTAAITKEFTAGQFDYDYYDAAAGGDVPPRKYRIRATSGTAGLSGFTDPVQGYCLNNALKAPSYSDWSVGAAYTFSGSQYKDITGYLTYAPVDSLQPLYWTCYFTRGSVGGGDRGWQSYNKELTYHAQICAESTYWASDTRSVTFTVAWRDTLVYSNSPPPSTTNGAPQWGGGGGWIYTQHTVSKSGGI
jgi:hypothetical protein